MSQIGIRLANRDFYPIIENVENGPQEKEIELTTVRDGQPQVQINLFKKDGEREDFIGSLVIEDLKHMECGEATISLKLHLDENKHLSAEAIDKDTGGRQSFGISIEELEKSLFLLDGFGESEPIGNKEPDFSESEHSFDFASEDDVPSVDSSFTEQNEGIGDIDLSFADVPEGESAPDIDLSFADMPEEDNTSSIDLSFADMPEEEVASDIDLSFADMQGGDDLAEEKDEAFVGDEPLASDDVQDYSGNSYDDKIDEDDSFSSYDKKSSFPLWIKICLALLCIFIISLVIVIFFRFSQKKELTNDVQESAKVEMQEPETEGLDVEPIDELTEESPIATKEPFAEMSKPKKESKENGESQKEVKEEVPKTEKPQIKTVESVAIKKSVRYRLRWGDTLWDISETFYKNPWKYKKIARYNGIKNPNHVVAGKYITIPAK